MTDAAAIVLRLKATLDHPGLSTRAASRCQRMLERLQAPVRVAVFGLPQAGKSAVINALAETTVLRPGAQSAPMLIRYADTSTATLTSCDGQLVAASAEMPFAPPSDAAMAELAAPLDRLADMSLLNVVADSSPQDMSAALAWAAPRCDIAIWCTRHWTAAEQAIWSNGPDALKNHTLMIAASPDETVPASRSFTDGSEQNWCDVTLVESGAALNPASSDLLRQRLARMIDEARTEDLDVAAFLVEEHVPEALRGQDRPQSPPDLGVVGGTTVSNDEDTPAPPPEARAVLSRLILHLRQTAQDAMASLAKDRGDNLLERFQNAFHQMLELAEEEHTFAETWPALHETLREADDLILLLSLEGSGAPTTEAAILLGQVRKDMEFALAA